MTASTPRYSPAIAFLPGTCQTTSSVSSARTGSASPPAYSAPCAACRRSRTARGSVMPAVDPAVGQRLGLVDLDVLGVAIDDVGLPLLDRLEQTPNHVTLRRHLVSSRSGPHAPPPRAARAGRGETRCRRRGGVGSRP